MTATSDTDEKITWVRVMCDYSADPVWGDDGAMLEIDDIEMSPRLKGRLREWADRFEELSARAEKESNQDLSAQWLAFAMQGRHIAASLKDEQPGLTVVYFDQSRITDAKKQDRTEFEYEMTTEMADKLFSETDWPDGDYMNFRCSHCRSPFLGPKRQPHCVACDEAFVKPAATLKALWDTGMRPVSAPPDSERMVLGLVSATADPAEVADLAGKVVAVTAKCETGKTVDWVTPDGVVLKSDHLSGWAELHEGIKP